MMILVHSFERHTTDITTQTEVQVPVRTLIFSFHNKSNFSIFEPKLVHGFSVSQIRYEFQKEFEFYL